MIPKPAKGTEKARLRAKRRAVFDAECLAKGRVRERDPHCRWPHLTADVLEVCRRSHNEVAHFKGKGMGGNKDGSRNGERNLIAFCAPVHQGPGSIHAGRKRVEPQVVDLGTRGPCIYLEKRGKHGQQQEGWIEVGRDAVDDRW